MPNTKQITFTYNIEKLNIDLEVNCVGTDNEIPFPEMLEPDSAEPYEVEIKSVMFNSQNILPILEHLEATQLIYNEAIKHCWKEFKN